MHRSPHTFCLTWSEANVRFQMFLPECKFVPPKKHLVLADRWWSVNKNNNDSVLNRKHHSRSKSGLHGNQEHQGLWPPNLESGSKAHGGTTRGRPIWIFGGLYANIDIREKKTITKPIYCRSVIPADFCPPTDTSEKTKALKPLISLSRSWYELELAPAQNKIQNQLWLLFPSGVITKTHCYQSKSLLLEQLEKLQSDISSSGTLIVVWSQWNVNETFLKHDVTEGIPCPSKSLQRERERDPWEWCGPPTQQHPSYSIRGESIMYDASLIGEPRASGELEHA